MQWGHLEERYAIKLCFKLERNATETYGKLQNAFGRSCMNRASVFVGIRDSRKTGSLWGMMRGVGGVRKSIQQSWFAKGFGLGLICWGFKGVQEEIPSEEASTLQIGSVAFPTGQCTRPQLHPCHRLFDSSSASLQSRPCSLWLAYSLSSKVIVMRQLRRWKRLWQRSLTHSHKSTSMEPFRSCWNGKTSALQP